MYLAVMKVENGLVAKFAQFEDEAAAREHVTRFSASFPDAFVAEKPDGNFWQVIDGNVSTYTPPVPVPQTVTMAQARLALAAAGLLETVETGLANLSEPQKTKALTAWEYSPSVSRNGELVNTLNDSFGITDAQLDDLFRAAAAIQL